MVSASTTPNGVAAVKLFPLHLLALPEEVFAEPERQFGAPVKMVHLRRRDKVRAGLSEWKAQMSGQWVRLPGEERTEVPRPPRDSEITKYHEFQHAWDRFWCASRADGVDWIELHYEDVVQDLGAAVQRIANFVGARLDSPAGAAKRTLRQSDPADDQLIERWVQATGGCDECGHV